VSFFESSRWDCLQSAGNPQCKSSRIRKDNGRYVGPVHRVALPNNRIIDQGCGELCNLIQIVSCVLPRVLPDEQRPAWRNHESGRMPFDKMPLKVSEVLQNELPRRRLSKATWSTTAAGLVLEVKRNRFVREVPDSFAYRSILFRVWEGDHAAAAGRFIEWMGPAISLVIRRCG
jgi:hypothetical protein